MQKWIILYLLQGFTAGGHSRTLAAPVSQCQNYILFSNKIAGFVFFQLVDILPVQVRAKVKREVERVLKE